MRPTALVAAMTLALAAAPAPAAPAPSLLHVGDSLATGSDPPLRQLLPGWSITTAALTSRPTAAGVAIIDRQPALPGALVVELGTNDSPDQSARFAGYVRHVLELAGPQRCVVWVNIHRPPVNGVSYAGYNRALDQLAALSHNLAVVDWNGMVRSGAAKVAGDGVHATPDGYRARAAAIAQALEGCSSQHASGGPVGGSHTLAAGRRKHRAVPAGPPSKPTPKPLARPKTIKVYTPKATAPAVTRTAARPSKGPGAGIYVLVGALAILLLGGGGHALARRRS